MREVTPYSGLDIGEIRVAPARDRRDHLGDVHGLLAPIQVGEPPLQQRENFGHLGIVFDGFGGRNAAPRPPARVKDLQCWRRLQTPLGGLARALAQKCTSSALPNIHDSPTPKVYV